MEQRGTGSAIRDRVRSPATHDLGHADLLGARQLAVEEVDGEVGLTPRSLDAGKEIRELVPPGLELEDRTTEGLALATL